MASNFGKTIQVSTFGASHGYAIGGIVEGLPCGHTIDIDELKAFLKRRAPGQNQLTTQRKEADTPEFLAGLVDGMLSRFGGRHAQWFSIGIYDPQHISTL